MLLLMEDESPGQPVVPEDTGAAQATPPDARVDVPSSTQASEQLLDDQRSLAKPTSTRTSRVWIGFALGLVVLVAILIFILQNLTSVEVHFPGASTKMPVGIAILFGFILGGIFVFGLSLARVLQLRHGMGRLRQAPRS